MYVCDYCAKSIGPKVPLRLLSVAGSERHSVAFQRNEKRKDLGEIAKDIPQSEFIFTHTLNPSSKESTMNGKVYSGHVVRTKTVAAGEGVTAGVQVSEIVFTNKEAFISQSPDTARAVILAAAIQKLGVGLNVNDPTKPIEVVLTVVG